jgi:hypothetical protein
MMTGLNAMAAPLKNIKQELLQYRVNKNKEISMTGQRVYLERLLNDLYDPAQRRIRVIRTEFIRHSYSYNRIEAVSDRFRYNRFTNTLLYKVGDYAVHENIVFVCIVPVESSFTLIDFEDGNKNFYNSGNVTLSGLSFNMTQALIGGWIEPNDFSIGERSARLRGYADSSISLLEDIPGLKAISFYYRRYGTDPQVDWMVQCSTDGGISWFQVGDTFVAPASNDIQQFSAQVNIAAPVRFRIKRATETGSINRRLNVDNIQLTGYGEPSAQWEDNFRQAGSVHFLHNKLEFGWQQFDFVVLVPFLPAQLPVEALRIRRKVEQYNIATRRFNINPI